MPVSTTGTQFNAARSRHRGGVNASFCDGSVHFFRNEVAVLIWQRLGTMDGKEVALPTEY